MTTTKKNVKSMRTRRTTGKGKDSPTASPARATRKTESARLITKLREWEKVARTALYEKQDDHFDRGYYLGLAHGYSYTRLFVVRELSK